MNSKQVKAAFQGAGLVVSVADLGPKFRICARQGRKLVDIPVRDRLAYAAVAIRLGLTNVRGAPGLSWNGTWDSFGYKPGAVSRAVHTYRNPWHDPRDDRSSGPAMFTTDATPMEHAGCLIYQRIRGVVWDVVKDGVCLTQRAGRRGAMTAAEDYTNADVSASDL